MLYPVELRAPFLRPRVCLNAGSRATGPGGHPRLTCPGPASLERLADRNDNLFDLLRDYGFVP